MNCFTHGEIRETAAKYRASKHKKTFASFKKYISVEKKSQTGLPDFSRPNIPKREKICQITLQQNIPNGHNMYQMAIK
jgi:hypothetical protein